MLANLTLAIATLVNMDKILVNGVRFAKFTKVFPCQNVVLYGMMYAYQLILLNIRMLV